MFRRTPPPSQRSPHPDGRKEAELQRVLSLFAAAARTAARLDTILFTQAEVDRTRRLDAGYAGFSDLADLAAELREERTELEDRIAAAHEEIAQRLEKLGDDACYLGEIPYE